MEDPEFTQDEPDPPAQRAADAELCGRLTRAGFAGPVYRSFERDMAAYGIAVCEAWLATGLMFRRCAEKGRPIGSPPRDWTEDDRRELVLETVATALRSLHDYALVKGEWNPEGGASLKTYFVGGCLLAFPSIFRSWQRERQSWARTLLRDDDLASLPMPGTALEDQVMGEMDLRQRLSDLDSRTAAALALSVEGYSQDEIAEILVVTKRAVEALLYRHRQRSAQREVEGGDHEQLS